MKILQIIYSLCSGGAERFVVDLSNRLAEDRNNEVVILVVDDLQQEGCSHYLSDVNNNVRIISLGLKGLGICSLLGIFKTIKKERPDVVHCHSNLILLYLPAIFCKGPRYVHTLHNLADKCLCWRWCKPINKHLYSRKVQAVTISGECSQSYRALYGFDNDCMIINGREKIQLTADAGKVKKEVDSLTEGKRPVFINVARFDPQKNHKLLFDIFERLSAEGSNAQLLVVGARHEENMIKYRNHPNIHIIGERRNVGDYLACADFFILSSVYEGLPLTLLEAMSMGVVPVCTPAGGIKDVIRDGENGFLAKDFDTESLYDAVTRAIKAGAVIPKDAVVREFHEKYSMERCSMRYYNLYRQSADFFPFSNQVLTIGCECDNPKGGVAYVLNAYKKFIYQPFKFVANSGEGSALRKIWMLVSSYIKSEWLEHTDKDIRFVHIHTASYNSFKRSTLYIRQAKRNGKKVIAHIHGGGFREFRQTCPKFVDKYLKKCDAVVALSENWREYFEKEVGLTNVYVVNNIIDKPKIQEIKKDGRFHLLFLGFITEAKGIFDLLDVIAEHKSEWNDKVVLHIGGKGKVEQLQKVIKEAGIENIVKYEGWVSGEKKSELFNMADAFILPSYTEGVPISILEAESYGLPILSTPVGGIPEIVVDEENGILFPPGDKQAMKCAIDKLIVSSALCEEMGEKSKLISENCYPSSIEGKLSILYATLK